MPPEFQQTIVVLPSNGPSWTFWAILLSTVIAIISIAAQRTISKRRSAIDLILASETPEFKLQRAELSDSVKNGNIKDILQPQSSKDHDRRRSISNVLNHYEIVAIAIFNRSVDEEIIKQYQHTEFVRTWDDCEDLIEEINNSGKSFAYSNFKTLATKWKKNSNLEPSLSSTFKNAIRELLPW